MRPVPLTFLVLGLLLIAVASVFAQTMSLNCLTWGCELFLGSFFLEAAGSPNFTIHRPAA